MEESSARQTQRTIVDSCSTYGNKTLNAELEGSLYHSDSTGTQYPHNIIRDYRINSQDSESDLNTSARSSDGKSYDNPGYTGPVRSCSTDSSYILSNMSLESVDLPRKCSEESESTTKASAKYGRMRSSVDQSMSDDLAEDSPSSIAERTNLFRSYVTLVSSCIYGVFIVTFGTLIYIQDLFTSPTSPIAEGFGIYLVGVGLLYYIFLKIDTKRYINKLKRRKLIMVSNLAGPPLDEKVNGLPNAEWTEQEVTPLRHDYCFASGRHSGSFYLKCGAAVFCFGLLIHSGCLIGYQVVFLTSKNYFQGCGSMNKLIRECLHPIYAFFQLYFIFKHSNIIINRYKELARFAMMHCIATSLCFWAWTILDETVDALKKYNVDISSTFLKSSESAKLDGSKQTSTNESLVDTFDNSSFAAKCATRSAVTDVFANFSPYLYPFTIEYSIMVAGVLFIIWQNIGNCSAEAGEDGDTCDTAEFVSIKLVIYADCRSTSKGLFAGLMVLALSVVSIILFGVVIGDNDYVEMGIKVNKVTGVVILILMTIAVTLAYFQVTRLDVNSHPVNQLDDLLLFVCIPAYFMYAIFSLPPALHKNDILNVFKILLQVLQVLLQTPMIMDGLRRCSNTKALRNAKPGKELITFLIVCNLAMWIAETFQIKSNSIKDYRHDVYGYIMWIFIKHMTVPLQMFYRFHSSVCLVDIWKSAYKKG